MVLWVPGSLHMMGRCFHELRAAVAFSLFRTRPAPVAPVSNLPKFGVCARAGAFRLDGEGEASPLVSASPLLGWLVGPRCHRSAVSWFLDVMEPW